MEQWWNDTDRGKKKHSEETCHCVIASTVNPAWTDLGSNSGLRVERLRNIT